MDAGAMLSAGIERWKWGSWIQEYMVSNKDSNHPGLTYEDSQSLEVVATIMNISIFQKVNNEVYNQEKKKKKKEPLA